MYYILPSCVAVFETTTDIIDPPLMMEEKSALGRSADKRRREFTTGRNCARRALAMLGLPAQPILIGQGRQPLWPEGIVGSITHCDGFCGAAVVRGKELAAVGIDAELHKPLPQEAVDLVLVEAERHWVHRMSGSGLFWDIIFFSAKESAFKALFPLTGTWLQFTDTCISVNPANQTFSVRQVDGPTGGYDEIVKIRGMYIMSDNKIFTSAVISRNTAELCPPLQC